MSDKTEKPAQIPVLWFDSQGRGPDEFRLELHPFPADADGIDERTLGIRVRANGFVIRGSDLVDGGFYVDRATIAELHKQLGAWLASEKPRSTP